jgi:hypothetical protein
MVQPDIIMATVIGVLLTGGAARAQEVNVDQIVKQKIQPILPKNGREEAWRSRRMNGRTSVP